MNFDQNGNFIISKEELLEIWSKTLQYLVEKDSTLLTENVQERSLCYRLVIYLKELFADTEDRGITVDGEYNRDGSGEIKRPHPGKIRNKNNNWIAPDIILHQRGSKNEKYKNDIFVCEVKKREEGDNIDAEKILTQMKERHYQFGINLYELNEKNIELDLYEHRREDYRDIQSEKYKYDLKKNKLEKQ